jgi:hypothetical protein
MLAALHRALLALCLSSRAQLLLCGPSGLTRRGNMLELDPIERHRHFSLKITHF